MPDAASLSAPADERAAHRRGARYGLSLACVLFGVHLVLQWQPAPLLSLGMVSTLVVLRTVLTLAIAVLVLAVGFGAAPTSPARTVPVALLALVAVPLAALILYLRMSGTLPGRPLWVWNLFTPSAVALGVAILGWLVVRERPVYTYLLAIGAAVPTLVVFGLMLAGADPSVQWYVIGVLSLVIGVGAAWLAAAVHQVTGRSPSTPAAPSVAPTPAPLP